MNWFPPIREKSRDVDLVGASKGVLLASNKLYRVTTESVKGGYLEKT